MKTINIFSETKKKMLSVLLSEVGYSDGSIEAVAQCIVDSALRYDMPRLLYAINKEMTKIHTNRAR